MMKRALAICFAVFSLSACRDDGIEQSKTNNQNIPVTLLFENDGCKVYRFKDNWNYIYFTNCQGSASWEERCGKNCRRPAIVPTQRTPE